MKPPRVTPEEHAALTAELPELRRVIHEVRRARLLFVAGGRRAESKGAKLERSHARRKPQAPAAPGLFLYGDPLRMANSNPAMIMQLVIVVARPRDNAAVAAPAAPSLGLLLWWSPHSRSSARSSG